MIIDVHVHVFGDAHWDEDAVLAAACRAGVDRVIVSCLGLDGYHAGCTIEEIADANRCTRDFVHRHKGFAWGLAYANPVHGARGLKVLRHELNGRGIVGVKLWTDCRASDERVFPIVEQAIRRRMPVLQHAWLKTHAPQGPGESRPADVAELARRYPEAIIMMPHLAGNQARGLREVAAYRNVILDTAGSDPEAGVVEAAYRLVGARRLVFGSDAPGRSFASQIAKVAGSRIPERAKRAVMGENIGRILKGLW